MYASSFRTSASRYVYQRAYVRIAVYAAGARRDDIGACICIPHANVHCSRCTRLVAVCRSSAKKPVSLYEPIGIKKRGRIPSPLFFSRYVQDNEQWKKRNIYSYEYHSPSTSDMKLASKSSTCFTRSLYGRSNSFHISRARSSYDTTRL